MFNKLIKNLPYNPSLISQVAFYAKRLKQESSIRRLGFLFITLTFIVQLFAVMAPPPQSAQAVTNDIIPGGVTSRDHLLTVCRSDARVRAVFERMAITCDNVANANPNITWLHDRSYNNQLYSVGFGAYTNLEGNMPLDIPVAGRAYAHYLWSWDRPGTTSDYRVIAGQRNDGSPFWVILDCGNPVTVGPPPVIQIPPPPPPPSPTKNLLCSALNMSVKNGSRVPLGTTINLRGQAAGNHLPKDQRADFYYTYTTDAKVPAPVTGFSRLAFNGQQSVTDNVSHAYKLTVPGHYIFTLAVKWDRGDAIGNKVGNCVKDVHVNNDTCKNPNDHDACIVQNKRASNITAGLADANNTTAKAGDVIEYTLSASNTQKYTTASKYVIKENIGDILQYADVVDLSGGVLDKHDVVAWPAQDIKASQTVQAKFTVKVKDPIPATPVAASDPGSFDMTMTNTYGDTVIIKLPPPPSKIIESTSSTLPNTGPGANMFLAVSMTMVIGYFFARSRLLHKELDIVRAEYTTGL